MTTGERTTLHPSSTTLHGFKSLPGSPHIVLSQPSAGLSALSRLSQWFNDQCVSQEMPLRGGLTVDFVTDLLSNDSNQATETVFLRNISLQGQEQFALELVQHNQHPGCFLVTQVSFCARCCI